jgi:hypothetical protein
MIPRLPSQNWKGLAAGSFPNSVATQLYFEPQIKRPSVTGNTKQKRPMIEKENSNRAH